MPRPKATPALAPAPADDLGLYIKAFRRHLDADSKSKKTIRLYSDAATNLADWLRDNDRPLVVANIARSDVEDYFIYLRERLSPATRNQVFRSLQQFWRYLIAEGTIVESPQKTIARPKIPYTPPGLVTIEQMDALVRACDGTSYDDRRDMAILRMFYSSGIRLAEMTGLRLADFDLDQKTARVTGKFDKTRDVRYGSSTGRAIDRYLRARAQHTHHDHPGMWLGQRGAMTVWGVSQMIERRAKQAKVTGVHAHAFRHAFADGFLSQGGQEGELMSQAGWATRSMVDRYASHVAGARARRNFDQFDPANRLAR